MAGPVPPRHGGHLNDFLDALREFDVLDIELENGEARYKLGYSDQDRGVMNAAVPWGQTGLVCLPDPPDALGACQAITYSDGVESRVLFTRDNRYAAKIGSLPAGSRGFISRGEARMLLNPEKEQVTLYSEQQDAGNSMMVDIDGSTDLVTIINGNTCVQMKDDEISLVVNEGASLQLTKDACVIRAASIMLIGGTVQLGDQGGGVPAPTAPAPATPTINSVLAGITGPAGAPSTKVFVAV